MIHLHKSHQLDSEFQPCKLGNHRGFVGKYFSGICHLNKTHKTEQNQKSLFMNFEEASECQGDWTFASAYSACFLFARKSMWELNLSDGLSMHSES